ncbi:MAG TPA: hypothetical protein VLF71_04900 [Candidatus Saccharimonadales bacterium]|nr:hypothetical protein [Candidatus Saccharimonadales bacterium]
MTIAPEAATTNPEAPVSAETVGRDAAAIVAEVVSITGDTIVSKNTHVGFEDPLECWVGRPVEVTPIRVPVMDDSVSFSSAYSVRP